MSSELGSVVVAFALPDESRPFVGLLTDLRTVQAGKPPALLTRTGRLDGRRVTVVHTGVGDTAAGRTRLRDAIAGSEDLRWVVSAGYAGGLDARVGVGELVLGENFSDPGLAASARRLLADEPLHPGGLFSQGIVAETAAAKATLATRTGALAVDMETAWIATVCAEASAPLLSLRVISDGANQDFPVPGRVLFDAVRQRPRVVALPVWLLAHPGRIAPFAAFVRGLRPARTRLARALGRLVERL